MANNAPPSYAWALHTEVANVPPHRLGDNASDGLRYARDLAEAAKQRGHDALQGYKTERLTLAELARRDGRAASTVHANIRRARQELFGDLSESAIYKRLQRKRNRPPLRRCSEPDCTEHLPTKAPRHRRYCNLHRTGTARVRRHRRTANRST